MNRHTNTQHLISLLPPPVTLHSNYQPTDMAVTFIDLSPATHTDYLRRLCMHFYNATHEK